MPIFGCTVYEGAAVQVHQNVRAAGNFWPAGRISDRHRQIFLFFGCTIYEGAAFLDALSLRVLQCKFMTGTGKNACFWTFA